MANKFIVLKCSICRDYIYSCMIMMPCLHNFCVSCISDWIARSKNCPNCAEEFVEIKKNPTLNNILENFMESHPHLRRPKNEYEKKYQNDRLKPSYKIVK